MAKKILAKGNIALCDGSIKAGLKAYFGYPITPQNEVPAYMSKKMPENGLVFLQAESELAAINMVLGASAAGVRCMTSSSSPGISLMQEAISYLAGCELPCVIANVMRGGPGLGNISGSQADYFQSTKGGGHGDYRVICLAPYSVQEMHDFAFNAFHLADKYRNPVMIISDGILGQMLEGLDEAVTDGVREKLSKDKLPEKDWVLDGCRGREPRFVRSLYMEEGALEKHNYKLKKKFDDIEKNEVLWEEYNMESADIVVTAFGITARIAKEAVRKLNTPRVGIIRPITLWPFPFKAFEKHSARIKKVLCVEHNLGQMVEDVRLAVLSREKVEFLGKPGGGIVTPDEITEKLQLFLTAYKK